MPQPSLRALGLVIWRVAAVGAAVALVAAPTAVVGRAPYRSLGLANRLHELRDMELTPSWVPNGLRIMSVAALLCGLLAIILPTRCARWFLLGGVPTLIGVATVRGELQSSDWTAPTGWLTIAVAGLAVAVAGAVLAPYLDRRRSRSSQTVDDRPVASLE